MEYYFEKNGISFSRTTYNEPRDSDFVLHVHDKYELLCFISGNVSYLVEGRKYAMYPGCIMLMRPAETHRLVVEGEGVYERFVLHFRADSLPESLRSLLRVFDGRGLGEKNRYLLEELGTDAAAEFERAISQSGVIDAYTSVFSALISVLCAANAAFPKKHNRPVNDETGRRLLNYVNENLTGDIGLDSVAEYIHLSPSQVNRIFRSLTGTSLYDYVLSKRIIMAHGLIEEGQSASYACRVCGFSDYSSFFRLYKKRMGHAPAAAKKEQ